MHAVELAPEQAEEQLLFDHSIMKTSNGALTAWDWQGLEIATIQAGLTIHPNKVVAFEIRSGRTLWTKNFFYDNDEQFLASVGSALALFGNMRRIV
jgi:hypothetical protein